MIGYYKAPELTAACFTEDGYLKTGDRGEIDSDGRLKITGRTKELFKTSKGKYVSPAPIENILNNDPNVELSLVSGSGYLMAHAVIQLPEEMLPTAQAKKGEITAALEALLKHTNSEVESYEKLGFLVVTSSRWTIESGHPTPTQKIKRRRRSRTLQGQARRLVRGGHQGHLGVMRAPRVGRGCFPGCLWSGDGGDDRPPPRPGQHGSTVWTGSRCVTRRTCCLATSASTPPTRRATRTERSPGSPRCWRPRGSRCAPRCSRRVAAT